LERADRDGPQLSILGTKLAKGPMTRFEGDTAFGHHRHEVSARELVLEVAAHAQDDDRAIKMAAFEDFGEAQQFAYQAPHSRRERRTSA
jgi:hypothetical protein